MGIIEELADSGNQLYGHNAFLRWQKILVVAENLLPQEFRERFQRCTDKFRYRKLSLLIHPDKTRNVRPEITDLAERLFKILADTYKQILEDMGQSSL